MKFKVHDSDDAMAASATPGDEPGVSDAAFGLAESEVGAGASSAQAAGVGCCHVNSDVAAGPCDDAGSFDRGLGQPKTSVALESVFADLTWARALLAEHSLSSLLNNAERALVISARASLDEVLGGLSSAAG